MGYRTLQACLDDLEATGHLLRVDDEVDANLEMAEIQRRVFAPVGRPCYLRACKGCRFPMVSNLFGTMDRAHFIFRDTLARVRQMIELKLDPGRMARRPWAYSSALQAAWHMLPRRVSRARFSRTATSISELPQLHSWPDDGGAFITLPQVYTEDPPSRAGGTRTWACIACSSRRKVRAERRGRPALSDSSRHRRASCGGDRPRRAAAREHLCRRSPAMSAGGGDAVARRDCGAVVRRGAGRASHSADRPRLASCRSMPRPISASAARSNPTRHAARRTVRRSLGLLQSGARLSGAAGRPGVSSRAMRSGRSRSSAGRRRKTRCSAS